MGFLGLVGVRGKWGIRLIGEGDMDRRQGLENKTPNGEILAAAIGRWLPKVDVVVAMVVVVVVVSR